MKVRLLVVIVLVFIWTNLAMSDEAAKDQIVKLGHESSLFTRSQFDKYITRGSFCSLVLDDFLFSEAKPGKFMVDITFSFNNVSTNPLVLKVVLQDLIEVKNNNDVTTHKLSNKILARQLPLVNVSDIDVYVRLIPIKDDDLVSFQQVMSPILGKSFYGLDIQTVGKTLDEFIKLARKGDDKDSILFQTNIPVAQNIVEATKLDTKDSSRMPLYNNRMYAIINEGSKSYSNNSLTGKAKDLLNGIWVYATGDMLMKRPASEYKSFISLHFTKDENQVLPETILSQLKQLSLGSQSALTKDSYNIIMSKASDADKSIDALVTAKQIDSRAEFHLRNYVELMRIWGAYRFASTGGDAMLKENNCWNIQFHDLFNLLNNMGKLNYTQSFGVADLYSDNNIAKIFVPYSLSDEMTIETVYKQITLHQNLKRLKYTELSQKSD